MQVRYHKAWSNKLNRDMEMKIYGHGGQPCLVYPCQDGRFFDFENFGMVDYCQPYIDQGRLTLYCVDSIDKETWSAQHEPPYDRVRRHEAYFGYITDEVWPFMMADTGHHGRAMTLGFSMGAYHAANTLFRRPDLFDTVIAMSGVYDPETFMGGYLDEVGYLNSPLESMRGMPQGHPHIEKLNTCKIILCTGQGAWEELMVASTGKMDQAMRDKGVHAWVDYWGHDVSHDWPWWKKQLPYFLDKVMNA